MEIDGYHACPCHSEKKIKFCCGKDIVHDLNQLLAKQGAGQELAALEECERAIKRHGTKDCLLTMKTQLLLDHDDVNQALAVNAQFREKNPHHPAGYHQLALLRLEKREVRGAVEALQDAVDAVKGNEIPVFLATGFRTVGLALLLTDFPFAARAHLKFALYLSGEQDPELKRFYFETFISPNLSVSHRYRWELPELTDAESQEDWGKKIITAGRGIARGQFRKSLKYLEMANQSFPKNEKLLYASAVASLFLNDRERSYQAWQSYKNVPGLPETKFLQADLMAYLFTPSDQIEQFPVVHLTVEVSDFNAVLEIATSDPRLQAVEQSETDEDEDSGPPPRNIFALLNQPYPKEQPLTSANTPVVTSKVFFYGKQTDRAARLVFEFRDVSENRDSVNALLDKLGEWQIGQPAEEVIQLLPLSFGLMFPQWSIPPDTLPAERSDLVHQLILDRLQEWTNTPVIMLGGKTPREASKDPQWQRTLKAILINLRLDSLSLDLSDAEFEKIWNDLELPVPEATPIENWRPSDCTPVELLYLPLEQLDDAALSAVVSVAFALQVRPVLRRVWREILKRPDNENGFPKYECLHQLALFSTKLTESLELFAQARAKVSQAGVPLGNYLVDEFEFRLSRGITDKLEELLSIIYQSHIHEPQVPQRMAMILQNYGLSVVPNMSNTSRPHSPAARTSQRSSILTSSKPGPAPAGGSKLWLPD